MDDDVFVVVEDEVVEVDEVVDDEVEVVVLVEEDDVVEVVDDEEVVDEDVDVVVCEEVIDVCEVVDVVDFVVELVVFPPPLQAEIARIATSKRVAINPNFLNFIKLLPFFAPYKDMNNTL